MCTLYMYLHHEAVVTCSVHALTGHPTPECPYVAAKNVNIHPSMAIHWNDVESKSHAEAG